MSRTKFHGVFTALVTPFAEDGSLDLDAYRRLIESQIEAGVNGLVPCGTTGEAATLRVDEHIAVVRTCVEQVAGRVPVIAGASSNDTAQAVELHREMEKLGVDATLHATPWYNKPTQEGLYRHFRALAGASDLPIVLYNVPGRTGVDLLPETIERLARDCPAVVAVKEATGSVARAEEILRQVLPHRPDFSVLSGEDAFILPLLAMGGHGVISVISHLCAADLVAMIRAFEQGELADAQAFAHRVAPLVPAMFFRSNPIPVKSALALLGQMQEVFRLPLCPLQPGEKAELVKRLAEAGYAVASA